MNAAGTPPLARYAPWIAAAAGLIAGLLTMTTHPIGIFYDDAIYLLTAKALAAGQGYVYPHLPGTPDAIHYPPGWPLVLAAAWKLAPRFPENVALLKLINPVMLAATGAGMVVAGRRLFRLDAGIALAAALAAVTSIPVLALANVLLSEPMFLALLFPVLLACERLVRQPAERDEVRLAIVAAALTAAIVLTRTIAGVAFIATVMVLLLDRRWRALLGYAVAFLVLMLPWQVFVWRASAGFPDELRGSYGPYLEWVLDGYRAGGWPFLRDVVAQNAGDGWRMVGAFVSPLATGAARHALTALAVLTLFVSIATAWGARAARITALALFGYLLAVVMWPYQTERFLWAAWPLVVLVATAGLVTMWQSARRRMDTGAASRVISAGVALAALLLVVGHETYNIRALARGWADSASEQMTRWTLPIAQYVATEPGWAGQVIAADASAMVALYTGLQVVPVDILTPEEHLREKTPQRFADELAMIDRRYRPVAYIFLPIEGRVRSLPLMRLDDGRTLRARPARGLPLHAFDVVTGMAADAAPTSTPFPPR